jgi:hypothetical protein
LGEEWGWKSCGHDTISTPHLFSLIAIHQQQIDKQGQIKQVIGWSFDKMNSRRAWGWRREKAGSEYMKISYIHFFYLIGKHMSKKRKVRRGVGYDKGVIYTVMLLLRR